MNTLLEACSLMTRTKLLEPLFLGEFPYEERFGKRRNPLFFRRSKGGRVVGMVLSLETLENYIPMKTPVVVFSFPALRVPKVWECLVIRPLLCSWTLFL